MVNTDNNRGIKLKKLLYFIVMLITFWGASLQKTAFAINSYTDKCDTNISNDVAVYNNIGTATNNKLYIKCSGSSILYNIKNVNYVTITTVSTDSTSVFSCNNKLYLNPYQDGSNVALEDTFVFLSGNQKFAIDKSGNIYKYIKDNTIMFPKIYYFDKIDINVPIEKYYGFNVYSINIKGEKTPLKLIKNKTSHSITPNSIRQFTCQKTFSVSGSNNKIFIDYDLGSIQSDCEIHQITFQGENLIVGNKPEKPDKPEIPEITEKPNEPTEPLNPPSNGNGSGGSSSPPSNPDWEYIDVDSEIYEPSITNDNLLQEGNDFSNDMLSGSMVVKIEKEASYIKSNGKGKTKKETVKKESNKKEKQENTETEIIINYEADTPISSSSDRKIEKVIAIISICCAAIIIIKTAGTGFSTLKK